MVSVLDHTVQIFVARAFSAMSDNKYSKQSNLDVMASAALT